MRDANDPLERQRVLDSLFTERELKKMQRLEEKEQNQNNEDNPNLDQELKRKILSRYEAMMYEDEGVDEDYVAAVYNPNEETVEVDDDETNAMKRPASPMEVSPGDLEAAGEAEKPENRGNAKGKVENKSGGKKSAASQKKETTIGGKEKGETVVKQKGKEASGGQIKGAKQGKQGKQGKPTNQGNQGNQGKQGKPSNQKAGDASNATPAAPKASKQTAGSGSGSGSGSGLGSGSTASTSGAQKKPKNQYAQNIERNKLNHHRKERADKKRGF